MTTINASFVIPYQFPVIFSDNLLQNDVNVNNFLRTLKAGSLVLPIVDKKVAAADPSFFSRFNELLSSHKLTAVPSITLPGGEACKNTEIYVRDIIESCIRNQIDRHSYIVAIGGGAFIDMVGYAAATIHRGIRLIRVPTTVLAQADAGIGVKNAINYNNRKNFLGTFYPPYAVINSYHFIESLSEQDKRTGIAEAIKVALIKDKVFFNKLATHQQALAQFSRSAMTMMIKRCAELHLQHICHNGDPFERGSARPLDFGHWCAHGIEELSNFTLKHGEAVAMVLIDSDYSRRCGWISDSAFATIKDLIIGLGFPVFSRVLNQLSIVDELENFRSHLGGDLCITMLNGIGECHEVSTIDTTTMQQCIDQLIK